MARVPQRRGFFPCPPQAAPCYEWFEPFFVPGERSYIAVAKNSPVLKYADDIRAALKLIELEGIHEDLVLKYLDRAAE